MLVRLKATDSERHRRRADLSEEENAALDEEIAATRIQSMYRGRKDRQKTLIRKAERTAGSCSEAREARRLHKEQKAECPEDRLPLGLTVEGQVLGRRESPGSLGEASSVAASSAQAEGSSPGGPQRLHPPVYASEGQLQPTEAHVSSQKSIISDYFMVRQDLEAKATTLPPWLQQCRISTYMLFEEPRSSFLAQAISIFLLLMIIVSIVCFLAETMPELKHVPSVVWLSIEVSCTIVFTIEYVSRILVCTVSGISVKGFVKKTTNIFDLLAILPFYISVAMQAGQMAKALGVLRIVRLVRLFRIFKLGRYSVGLQVMAQALRNSGEALGVLCFFLCVGILLFSSAVYYVEKMSCPDVDDLQAEPHRLDPNSGLTEWHRYVGDCRASPSGKHATHGLCCDEFGSPLDFPSIVEAFWWSTVTMTTVGFGEVYPRTELGKIVATATMLSGILLIALPVAIIGRKFQEVYESKEYGMTSENSATFRPDRPNDGTMGRSMTGESATSGKTIERQPSTISRAREPVKAPEGPSLSEMSRRLRLMKMPDAGMSHAARELAETLDDAGDMQQEISSMEREDKARREEIVDIFDGLLKRFGELLDPDEDAKKAKIAAPAQRFKMAGLIKGAKLAPQAEANSPTLQSAAAPPLPPPPDAPPSDHRGAQVVADVPQAVALPPGIVETA